MNTKETQKVKFDKTEHYSACFVNDESEPDEKIPLNFYRYDKCGFGDNKPYFYRLYYYTYNYLVPNSDITVKYSLYAWEVVKVKRHCWSAMMQLIDSQKGMEEFLENED
jgi:hypothetical protein